MISYRVISAFHGFVDFPSEFRGKVLRRPASCILSKRVFRRASSHPLQLTKEAHTHERAGCVRVLRSGVTFQRWIRRL